MINIPHALYPSIHSIQQNFHFIHYWIPHKKDHSTPSRTNSNFGTFQDSLSPHANSMNVGCRQVQRTHTHVHTHTIYVVPHDENA